MVVSKKGWVMVVFTIMQNYSVHYPTQLGVFDRETTMVKKAKPDEKGD